MRGGRAPSGGQYNNGGASPPLRVVNGESGSGQVRSIDLVRSTGAPAGLRRASALVTVAVSVAEHERGRDPELALEARAPLLPALLVLELVLVQRRRLLDAVSEPELDRKSTRLNSSHSQISYAVFCLQKKTKGTGRWRAPAASRRGCSDAWVWWMNRPRAAATRVGTSVPYGHYSTLGRQTDV